MSWGPRSARKPPFGANNRGAVAPKLNQPVLYLLKRWQSRGGASGVHRLKICSEMPPPIDVGFPERFLRGINLKECYRDEHGASKTVLPNHPPERRPVTVT